MPGLPSKASDREMTVVPQSEKDMRPNWVSAVIFIGFFALYALLPTKNFNYADDSLRWAHELTGRGNLINSHHLFLNTMRWVYQSLHATGLELTPERLLAVYAAFWGATGLAILYWLLRRAGFGALAVWGTLVCGFSAGYWSYAIVGDVYAPSVALMVAGIGFSYVAITSAPKTFPWRSAAAAISTFTLMLFHHQAMFYLVIGVGVAAVFLSRGTLARRAAIGSTITAGAAALAMLIYTVAYTQTGGAGKWGSFLRFAEGYVDNFDARPDQKRIQLGTLLNWAAGEVRALVSTNVMFRSDSLATAVQSKYQTRAIYPFPYLVESLPKWLAAIVAVLALLAVGLAFALVIRGLWFGVRERGLIALICFAAVPQLIFFIWWEGISDEFCLWTIPLLAIAAVRGAASTRRPQQLMATLTGLVFISTLIGSTALYWNAQRDVDLVNDKFTTALSSKDFLVGFEDIQSDSRIKLAAERQGFQYFNVRTNAPRWTEAESAKINSVIKSAVDRGMHIHVSPRLLHPPKSEVNFLNYVNKDFQTRRRGLIAQLRAMRGVEWPELKVFLPKFFYSDPTGS